MFECAAKGESLTISWTKNDGRVHNASKSHILNEDINGGRRSILKVKKSKIADSGYYQCTAANTDNKVVSSKPAELLSKITSPNKLCSYNTIKFFCLLFTQFYHQ